jgi:hypothetical protein
MAERKLPKLETGVRFPSPAPSPDPGSPGTVVLYWIPLGTDGHVVMLSGRCYEALVATRDRRPRRVLYHTALEVWRGDGRRFVVESAPIRDGDAASTGAVAEGPVGSRWLGRFSLFRYAVRRWEDGVIPDAYAAVPGPIHIAADAACAERIYRVVPLAPTPVWGRDELGTGDMWNSNSLTAWVLCQAGIDAATLEPPPGGRAPGWHAGLAVAARTGGTTDGLTDGPGSAEPSDIGL